MMVAELMMIMMTVTVTVMVMIMITSVCKKGLEVHGRCVCG